MSLGVRIRFGKRRKKMSKYSQRLKDCVMDYCNTEKEYGDMALKVATNSEKLSEIRNKLKINRNTKPLFNTSLYTKNRESAYKAIYEKYLNKVPIENIEI